MDPSARAVFRLASDETARFEVSGLAPTDGRHVYELWLMDSTSDLISVATFRVNAAGRAQLTLTLPAAPSHFRYLDVSLYHVIPGSLPASEVVKHKTLTTAEGAALTITVKGMDVYVNKAQVTQANIHATNGYIHVINAVLIPPSK